MESPPPDGGVPGWHVDPENHNRLRWWTGTEWSATTAPRPSPPPPVPAAPAPANSGGVSRTGDPRNTIVTGALVAIVLTLLLWAWISAIARGNHRGFPGSDVALVVLIPIALGLLGWWLTKLIRQILALLSTPTNRPVDQTVFIGAAFLTALAIILSAGALAAFGGTGEGSDPPTLSGADLQQRLRAKLGQASGSTALPESILCPQDKQYKDGDQARCTIPTGTDSAETLLITIVRSNDDWNLTVDVAPSATGENTATPTQTDTPTPSDTETAATPAPTDFSDMDAQGFIGSHASCDADDSPAATGRTAQSQVVICNRGDGSYYYRGVRLSDGAESELDGAQPLNDSFEVASDGGYESVYYTVSPERLTITSSGKLLASEPMLEYRR